MDVALETSSVEAEVKPMQEVKCSCGFFTQLGCASSQYLHFSFGGRDLEDHKASSREQQEFNPTRVLEHQPGRCHCMERGCTSALVSRLCFWDGDAKKTVFLQKAKRLSPSSWSLQPLLAVLLECPLSKGALSKLSQLSLERDRGQSTPK